MNVHQRSFVAGVVGHATEAVLANEHLGVKRQASSELNGDLAQTGIALGWAMIALGALGVVLLIALAASCSQTYCG